MSNVRGVFAGPSAAVRFVLLAPLSALSRDAV